MKIKKITIKNFRCFNGNQEIEFNTDGKITLIYGPSGAGKTSLLSFISWVLFGEFKKVSGDKPLYNKSIAEKARENKTSFNVEGKIEMFDNNNEYIIVRKIKHELINNVYKAYPDDVELLYRTNNNADSGNISFIPYEKNVAEKINELVPKSLSRYFFFKGETGIDLADKTNSLEQAIYSIFDLNKYEKAIEHLGSKSSEYSLIGKLNKEITKYSVSSKYGNLSEVQSLLFKNKNALPKFVDPYNQKLKLYESNEKEIENCFNELREFVNGDKIKKENDANNEMIEMLQSFNNKFIKEFTYKLTNLIPYLLLSSKAIAVSEYLADIAVENKKKCNDITFMHVTKEILEEIKRLNSCICGRNLEPISQKFVQDSLDMLPPNSFAMLFDQFVQKNKNKLISSNSDFIKLNSILADISKNSSKINELLLQNEKNIKTLENSDVEREKALGEKIKSLQTKNKTLNQEIGDLKIDIKKIEKNINLLDTDYEKLLKSHNISKSYKDQIEVLDEMKMRLKNSFTKKKQDVRYDLEECIEEIFCKLSTRIEEHNGGFLQQDFTLRETYKTGGQEIIDVYSYIIGMIEALKKTDPSGENEFPIIVDAPFSKLDKEQLVNVIDVMPEIVSQVAFFTFDTDRIKEFADTSKIGYVWNLISDEFQENTRIIKGEL